MPSGSRQVSALAALMLRKCLSVNPGTACRPTRIERRSLRRCDRGRHNKLGDARLDFRSGSCARATSVRLRNAVVSASGVSVGSGVSRRSKVVWNARARTSPSKAKAPARMKFHGTDRRRDDKLGLKPSNLGVERSLALDHAIGRDHAFDPRSIIRSNSPRRLASSLSIRPRLFAGSEWQDRSLCRAGSAHSIVATQPATLTICQCRCPYGVRSAPRACPREGTWDPPTATRAPSSSALAARCKSAAASHHAARQPQSRSPLNSNRHDDVELLLITPATPPFSTKNLDTHRKPRTRHAANDAITRMSGRR